MRDSVNDNYSGTARSGLSILHNRPAKMYLSRFLDQKLDGRDLSPLLDDLATEWKHPMITTYGEGRSSVRSGPWRYVRYPDGEEELYDHRSDPHELTNLSSETEHAERKRSFRGLTPTRWEPSLGGRKG